MVKKKSHWLNVEKVLEDFRKYEESKSKRKGMLKIEAPSEEALKRILKAKPEPKKRKGRNDKRS